MLLTAAPAVAQMEPPPSPQPPPSGASAVLPAITVTAPAALEAQPTDAASERRISGETLNERPDPQLLVAGRLLDRLVADLHWNDRWDKSPKTFEPDSTEAQTTARLQ